MKDCRNLILTGDYPECGLDIHGMDCENCPHNEEPEEQERDDE